MNFLLVLAPWHGVGAESLPSEGLEEGEAKSWGGVPWGRAQSGNGAEALGRAPWAVSGTAAWKEVTTGVVLQGELLFLLHGDKKKKKKAFIWFNLQLRTPKYSVMFYSISKTGGFSCWELTRSNSSKTHGNIQQLYNH